MDGVAYTKSSSKDEKHKKIYFSSHHVLEMESTCKAECYGVLTHEIVHCFQEFGEGTVPSGLIEGIAGELTPSIGQ